MEAMYNSKTGVKRPLSKRQKKLSFKFSLLNAGQKYCRMLQGEHSAILLTFIKLSLALRPLFCPFVSGCVTRGLLYCFVSHIDGAI